MLVSCVVDLGVDGFGEVQLCDHPEYRRLTGAVSFLTWNGTNPRDVGN